MNNNRKPNFQNLLKVLSRQVPDRATIFELFLNNSLYQFMAGREFTHESALEDLKVIVDGFCGAGYDYATTYAMDIVFHTNVKHHSKTTTLNEGQIITDRASFEAYKWPNPDEYDVSKLDDIVRFLPEGMKLMIMGPGGVLENVIALVGYDNLCYMLFEDPKLLQDIFDRVGSILVRYYEIAAPYESVGVIMSNDDWGFNTQTFLSVEDMRKYVFPWHKKIVEVAHSAGKPVILHSCGFANDIMEDIIEVIGYDGKHSYEDNIFSVEESYKKWGGRIAILGGIDVDFLIRSNKQDIINRCENMLELTSQKGGYALGSGNSIPEYIPKENYLAMTSVALKE